MHSPAERSVVVYGTTDCEDTRASRALLATLHVGYLYEDLNIPESLSNLDWILGAVPHKKPTIVVFERLGESTSQIVSHIMEVPGEEELFGELQATGFVAPGITLEDVKNQAALRVLAQALEKKS